MDVIECKTLKKIPFNFEGHLSPKKKVTTLSTQTEQIEKP